MSFTYLYGYFTILGLLIIAVFTSVATRHTGEVREYCETDLFEAHCDPNHVVLVTTAEYGRMRVGRCTNQTQNLGCSSNVLGSVSNWCSGRQECSFHVSTLISVIRPCSSEFRNFLEASYICVPVLKRSGESCHEAEGIVPISDTGYISSHIEYSSTCASINHPWVLQAGPGQRINITLLDFSTNSVTNGEQSWMSHGLSDGIPTCTVYATIKEMNGAQTTTVCGGTHSLQWSSGFRNHRDGAGHERVIGYLETDVYHSLNNTVEIRIIAKKRNEESKNNFMLKYIVAGCEDPPLPPGTWMKRDDSTALLGCRGSTSQWTLKCSSTGTWRNIDQPLSCPEAELRSSVISGEDLPHIFKGISMLVIIAVAVSVGITILLAGIIYLRRRRRRQRELVARSATLSQNSKVTLQYSTDGAKYQQGPVCMRYSDNEYNQTMKWQQDGRFVTYPYPQVPIRENCPTAHKYSETDRPYSQYPASEHLYESPNFDRRDFTDDVMSGSTYGVEGKETVLGQCSSGQSV